MGKMSRTKGHDFEREIARDFQSIGYKDAKRNVTEAQTGGQGIDLVGTDIFDVQCKRKRAYSPINTIDEVPVTRDRIRLLITKADRKPAMAVLEWNDLMDLIRK